MEILICCPRKNNVHPSVSHICHCRLLFCRQMWVNVIFQSSRPFSSGLFTGERWMLTWGHFQRRGPVHSHFGPRGPRCHSDGLRSRWPLSKITQSFPYFHYLKSNTNNARFPLFSTTINAPRLPKSICAPDRYTSSQSPLTALVPLCVRCVHVLHESTHVVLASWLCKDKLAVFARAC